MGLIKALLEERARAKRSRQERAQQRRRAWTKRRDSLLNTIVEKFKTKEMDWKAGEVSLLEALQRPAQRVWAAALTHRVGIACWILSFLVGWGSLQLLEAEVNMATPLAVMPAKNVASAGVSIADPVFARNRGARQGEPVLVSTRIGLENLADQLYHDGAQRNRWVAAVDDCFSKGECHQETASLSQSWLLFPAAGMNRGDRSAERHFLREEHVIFAWPKADAPDTFLTVILVSAEAGCSIALATVLLLVRRRWKTAGLRTGKTVWNAELCLVLKSMGVLVGLAAGGPLLSVWLALAGCAENAMAVNVYEMIVFIPTSIVIAAALKRPAENPD